MQQAQCEDRTMLTTALATLALTIGAACILRAIKHTTRHTMPANQNEALEAFRGAYGQLCVLMAAAVEQEQSRDLILEAARGKGNQTGIFKRLRAQRQRVNKTLDACKSCVSTADLVLAGRDVKAVVESEWMVNIPMFAEVAHG